MEAFGYAFIQKDRYIAGPFLLNKKYAFQLLIEHFFETERELSAFLLILLLMYSIKCVILVKVSKKKWRD